MLRRVLAPAIIIALVGSGGMAYAAFPSTSPTKSGEISIAANPQKVAVDLTDDTAYVVGTGPPSTPVAKVSEGWS